MHNDALIERRILGGLIHDSVLLASVSHIWRKGLFEVKEIGLAAKWCLDYYRRYGKAPGLDINAIFETHARNGMDEESAIIIQRILKTAQTERVKNTTYLLDRADEYFKGRVLRMLSEDVITHVSNGDIAKADALVRGVKLPDMSHKHGSEPLKDRQLIADAVAGVETDVLFKMPGKLGAAVGAHERDTFIAFMGPEKRGKSYWLLEYAMRALRNRLNVAFFEAGDMSERQVVRRMALYVANDKINSLMQGKKDSAITARGGEVKIPTLDCFTNQDERCLLSHREGSGGPVRRLKDGKMAVVDAPPEDYVPCAACRGHARYAGEWKPTSWFRVIKAKLLTSNDAIRKAERYIKASMAKRLKLSCHPTGTLSPNKMESILEQWAALDDFIPDVVIVDYADILTSEERHNDFRHKTNAIWMALRALSQKWHVCLVTATQADADSYSRHTMSEKNFSEDKRKYAQVHMILTLNQDKDDKRAGIMRIGRMFVREADYVTGETVPVLEGKALGRAYLDSF